jgi:predicted secreted protein
MKTEESNNEKESKIIFSKRLEQYKNREMFPKKMAKVKEIIAKHGLPKIEKQG